MSDFRIRVIPDLAGLREFDTAVRASVSSSTQLIQEANTRMATTALGPLTGGPKTPGLFAQSQQATVDTINRTFQQSSQIVRTFVSGYKKEMDSLGEYHATPIFSQAWMGNVNQAIGNLDRYLAASAKLGPLEQRVAGIRLAQANREVALLPDLKAAENLVKGRQDAISSLALSTPEGQKIKIYNSQINDPNLIIAEQQAALREEILTKRVTLNSGSYKPFMAPNTPETDATKLALETNIAQLQQQLASLPDTIPGTIARMKSELPALKLALQQQTEPLVAELNAAKERLKIAQAEYDSVATRSDTAVAFVSGRNVNFLEQQAAVNAAPPVTPQAQQLFQNSPQLLARLQKAGLGVTPEGVKTQFGTSAFEETIAKQNFQIQNLIRDATRGETQFAASFISSQKGLVTGNQLVSASINDNGKVITKWGGSLAGAGNLVQATGRKILQLSEYAIGGAVVFGTLTTVLKELSNVTVLDANLKRLSLTAGLTTQETQTLFKSLSAVAISTATPLTEVVKAADDIALAVKNAGDSTETYKNNIIALTEAVGILTNLTGIDTVKATDLLTSAFKQLEIAPTELLGILNKVTAAAGSQSSAIQDIIQGVATLASAAKAGNLSVDDMIGAIQTLSQVTSKTPSEVSTSIKNLIGSLGSPASIKALTSYGIAIKDQTTGAVRNILDVYKEISQKVAQGIIPAGDEQALIRAISGGPRRAPDAAALLTNIDRVYGAITKSQDATNQALIANAQILDTNQAKIVQFQNSLDVAFYEQFNGQIKEIIGNLADFAKTILALVRSVPPGLSTMVVQVVALAAAFKVVRGIMAILPFKNLLSDVGNLKASILGLVGATESLGVAGQTASKFGGTQLTLPFGSKEPTPPGTIGGVRKSALGIAGAAGIGALAYNSGAGIGTSLQLAGAAASFIPGIAPVGIGLVILGTALQLFEGQSKNVTQEVTTDITALYAAFNKYSDAKQSVDTLTKANATLSATIQNLESVTNPTIEQQNTLNGTYLQLAQNASDAATATLSLRDAYSEILKLGPQAAKNNFIKNFVPNFTPEQAKSYQQQLSSAILSQSDSGFVGPSNFNDLFRPIDAGAIAPQSTYGDNGLFKTGTTLLGNAQNSGLPVDDLAKLVKEDAGSIRDVLSGIFSGDLVFKPTIENLGYIHDALLKIKDDTDPTQFTKYLQDLQSLSAKTSAVFATSLQNAGLDAYIKAATATGGFSPSQQTGLTAALTLREGLISGLGNTPRKINSDISAPGLPGGNSTYFDQSKSTVSDIQNILGFDESGQPKFKISDQGKVILDQANALKLFTDSLSQTPGLLQSFNQQSQKSKDIWVANWLKTAGIDVSYYTTLLQHLTDITTENTTATALNDNAQNDLITAYKNRASLFAQASTGGTLPTLNQLSTSNATTSAVPNLNKFLSGSTENLGSYREGFSKLIGLEQLAIETSNGFVVADGDIGKEILANITLFNLQGDQITKYIADLEKLGTASVDLVKAQGLMALLKKGDIDGTQAQIEAYGKLASAQELVDFWLKQTNEDQKAGIALEAKKSTFRNAAAAITAADAQKKADEVARNQYNISARSTFASRSAALDQQNLNGDFKDNPERYTQLKAQINEAYKAQVTLNGALSNTTGLKELEKRYSTIPGLQNAATLTAGDFVTKLLEIDVAAGLSASQIHQQMLEVLGLSDALNGLKSVDVIVNLHLNDPEGLAQALGISEGAAIVKERNAKNPKPTVVKPVIPPGSLFTPTGGGGGSTKQTSYIDQNTDILQYEKLGLSSQKQDIATIIANAKKLQAATPGAVKADKGDIVQILNGTKVIATIRNISEERLRKSIDELAAVDKARLAFDTKADTIRRIRIGSGDFAAIGNVPYNSKSGVSAGPNNIDVNINGQLLTPAQMKTLADQIGAYIKQSIASS